MWGQVKKGKDMKQDGVRPVPVAFQQDMEELIGYLLTQIDASVMGSNREALKSLIKSRCWEWYNELKDYTEVFTSAKTCKCKGPNEGCSDCSLVVANNIKRFDEQGIPEVEEIPDR